MPLIKIEPKLVIYAVKLCTNNHVTWLYILTSIPSLSILHAEIVMEPGMTKAITVGWFLIASIY